ncbi:Eaa1 [Klebsiella pneumoniae]|nr:Eaa1 [Klebsiella pneumoniae]
MTNNQLAENSVIQLLNSVKLARDNAERADNRVDHSFYYALTIALEELQERRKAAMDSEPEHLPLDYLQGQKDGLEWASQLAEANHPETGDWLYDDPIELAKAIRKGPDMPPAQPVEDSESDRNPVLAYADSYRDMAKQGVESVPIWSVITDLERNIAPLYRHVQPAPVVPENCVTAEHRRVIEMLLNVCGAAFELADDSCQQDVDGEDCHVVPDDAFQKLSDALDEIENTLPTEDIDRPDVFLAWSAMPRAALKSLLQAQPVPVVVAEAQSRAAFEQWCTVNIERNKWHPEFYAHLPAREQWVAWEACRAAMLQAGNSPAQSDCCPAQNVVSPAQSPIDHGYQPECECSGCKATARICTEMAVNSLVIPNEMTSEQAYEIGYYYGDPVDVFARGANWMRQHIIDSTLAAAPQLPGSEPATVPGKWIPVSERMPENGVSVLTFDGMYKRVHHAMYGHWQCWEPEKITHWMPLPAAPQEPSLACISKRSQHLS